jgi:hypothetical protein
LGDSGCVFGRVSFWAMAITNGFNANLGMLLTLACPTDDDVPFFNDCMKRAKAHGLSWEESLRYTIGARQQLEQGEMATPFELAPQKRMGRVCVRWV